MLGLNLEHPCPPGLLTKHRLWVSRRDAEYLSNPVTESAGSLLSEWESFYVIVGSSSAALIGLQFVVIALVADLRRITAADSVSAYGTPTVVHFAFALLVSAIMSAPWSQLFAPQLPLGVSGLGGLAYGALVMNRARRQTDYSPVWEDWIWYSILPFGSYAALALAALFLKEDTYNAAFVIGGASLGLLFIGIHNAWDSVTYIVFSSSHGDSTHTE
jgi:hypothetical protein